MAKHHEASDETALVELVQLVHIGHGGSALGTRLLETTWDCLHCVFASIVDLSPIEPLYKISICHCLKLFPLCLAHAFEAIFELLFVLLRKEVLLRLARLLNVALALD